MSRPRTAIALFLLLAGACPALAGEAMATPPDSAAAAPADSAAADSSAVGALNLPFLADSSLASAELDTTVYRLRGMSTAREIIGEKGWWAVNYNWFELKTRPGQLFTEAQVDSLVNSGAEDMNVSVSLIPLRVKVYAPSIEWLKSSAPDHRPARPPQSMIEAVREAGGRRAAPR